MDVWYRSGTEDDSRVLLDAALACGTHSVLRFTLGGIGTEGVNAVVAYVHVASEDAALVSALADFCGGALEIWGRAAAEVVDGD